MIKSIILAAGEGTRLRPLTKNSPKCLVELNGKSLLEHQTATLHHGGITDITVVGGFCADQIADRGYQVIMNDTFDRTNMVHSLFCAEHMFDGTSDLLISYGDIVYQSNVLQAALDCPADVCVVIDRRWKDLWSERMEDPLLDAETLKLDSRGALLEVGRKPDGYDDIEGQYIGLIKIAAAATMKLRNTYNAMDRNTQYDGRGFDQMYMTSFLQHLIDNGWTVQSAPIQSGWLEVDSLIDLEAYGKLHNEGRLASFYRARP